MVCSTSNIAQIDASEGVSGSCIAAHGDGFRYGLGNFNQIQRERCRTIFVLGTEGTAVPVIGNTLVAGLPC